MTPNPDAITHPISFIHFIHSSRDHPSLSAPDAARLHLVAAAVAAQPTWQRRWPRNRVSQETGNTPGPRCGSTQSGPKIRAPTIPPTPPGRNGVGGTADLPGPLIFGGAFLKSVRPRGSGKARQKVGPPKIGQIAFWHSGIPHVHDTRPRNTTPGPGSSPAKIRPARPISGPEALLRNIGCPLETPGILRRPNPRAIPDVPEAEYLKAVWPDVFWKRF